MNREHFEAEYQVLEDRQTKTFTYEYSLRLVSKDMSGVGRL